MKKEKSYENTFSYRWSEEERLEFQTISQTSRLSYKGRNNDLIMCVKSIMLADQCIKSAESTENAAKILRKKIPLI